MPTHYDALSDDPQASGAHLDWARNKTILLLGDSLLRDVVWGWSEVTGIEKEYVRLDEVHDNEKTMSWSITHPGTGLRIMSGFLYGMIDYNKLPLNVTGDEWPKPGPWNFEDRLVDLAHQFRQFEPDLVMANAAAWDFKAMYRRDLLLGLRSESVDPDLQQRTASFLELLPRYFPKSKVLFMTPQRFGLDDQAAREAWSKNVDVDRTDFFDNPKMPLLFTSQRRSELRAMYQQAVAESGIDHLDYWKIAEAVGDSYLRPGDSIHPDWKAPIPILTSWIFYKLARWVQHGI